MEKDDPETVFSEFNALLHVEEDFDEFRYQINHDNLRYIIREMYSYTCNPYREEYLCIFEGEKMELFEFAVVFVPNADQKKAGEKPQIVVDKKSILARDEAQARFQASRAVPEGWAEKFEQLEITVRPF